MAEELRRLVQIGLDETFIAKSIKRADDLAVKIKEIADQKKNEGTISAENEGKLKALTAERNKNIQVLKQANLLTSKTIEGQEKLKAQLSILTANFSKLTTEEQQNTEAGRLLQKNILSITNELKANEKAVGDNRRNVGNYSEAIEDALGATTAFGSGLGGMVGGLKAATSASLKFLATPIGAAIGALALAVGAVTGLFKLFSESLNRTEEGSAALAKVTQTFSAIMNGVLKVLEPLATSVMQGVADGFDSIGKAASSASGALEKGLRFFGLDKQADSVGNFTNAIGESVKGTRELADAQVELNKINREFQKIQLDYQNRAEKLRQIRDDEALSIEERKKANVELGQVLEEQSQKELKLANRALEIANKRAEINGESTENLDAIAEAETKILEIEERISGQRSEQLVNTNSLIRDQRTLLKEAATEKAKQTEQEIKAEQDRVKAIEQGYIEERALIDQQAEIEKAQAIIDIANEEERAERIAFIEKEALQAKLNSLDDETAAYTASADMVGAIDEKKYAKQIAEIKKLEAEKAAMDRAAKQEAYVRNLESISLQENLEIQAAELSIDNAEDLEKKKNEIALKYLNIRLQAMKLFANQDGIISDEEKQKLQELEIAIDRIKKKLGDDGDNGGVPSLAEALGLEPDDLEAAIGVAQAMAETIMGVLDLAMQANNQRIENIDRQAEAEIQAAQNSTESEEKKSEKIKAIEKKAAMEKYKLDLKNFKLSQGLQITNAIIQTAQAAIAAYSSGAAVPIAGVALGPAMAAIAAAFGAVQIGIIASKKPPSPPAFAKGGYISGAGSGTSDSIPARLSNGESVMNAKSTSMFAPIISAMNKAGGGVDWYRGEGFSKGGLAKFASGGIAISSDNIMRENESTAEITRMIMQTPPVLVLEDFQSVQGRQVRTEQNLQV